MKIEHGFFIIGIVFLFATVVYFAYEYILSFAKEVKSLLLLLLCGAFFFAGEYLRGRDA
jgi:hypothetical protein